MTVKSGGVPWRCWLSKQSDRLDSLICPAWHTGLNGGSLYLAWHTAQIIVEFVQLCYQLFHKLFHLPHMIVFGWKCSAMSCPTAHYRSTSAQVWTFGNYRLGTVRALLLEIVSQMQLVVFPRRSSPKFGNDPGSGANLSSLLGRIGLVNRENQFDSTAIPLFSSKRF